MADIRTYNVVILGIGFLLIFTAFTTCGNIEVSRVSFLLPAIETIRLRGVMHYAAVSKYA